MHSGGELRHSGGAPRRSREGGLLGLYWRPRGAQVDAEVFLSLASLERRATQMEFLGVLECVHLFYFSLCI